MIMIILINVLLNVIIIILLEGLVKIYINRLKHKKLFIYIHNHIYIIKILI